MEIEIKQKSARDVKNYIMNKYNLNEEDLDVTMSNTSTRINFKKNVSITNTDKNDFSNEIRKRVING